MTISKEELIAKLIQLDNPTVGDITALLVEAVTGTGEVPENLVTSSQLKEAAQKQKNNDKPSEEDPLCKLGSIYSNLKHRVKHGKVQGVAPQELSFSREQFATHFNTGEYLKMHQQWQFLGFPRNSGPKVSVNLPVGTVTLNDLSLEFPLAENKAPELKAIEKLLQSGQSLVQAQKEVLENGIDPDKPHPGASRRPNGWDSRVRINGRQFSKSFGEQEEGSSVASILSDLVNLYFDPSYTVKNPIAIKFIKRIKNTIES